MENFDYKILKFVCESDSEPVRACDIESKFGKSGFAAANSLYRDRLVSWTASEDDILSRDRYGVIKPTDKGYLEYERFSYNRQLKSGEVWKERIIGALFGILSTVTAEFIIRFLLSQ